LHEVFVRAVTTEVPRQSRLEDEVAVTQERVHVIWMNAKVPPVTRNHIRQTRNRRTNITPSGPQEDHRDPTLRRRVLRQPLWRLPSPLAHPTGL